jgi:hypothetical protein
VFSMGNVKTAIYATVHRYVTVKPIVHASPMLLVEAGAMLERSVRHKMSATRTRTASMGSVCKLAASSSSVWRIFVKQGHYQRSYLRERRVRRTGVRHFLTLLPDREILRRVVCSEVYLAL